MIIRREQAADRPEILALVRQAFPSHDEARLLGALFASRDYVPALSLVAQAASGDILGHVLSTRAWVGERPAAGLGPLAVAPPYQGQGVGSALLRASVQAANEQLLPVLVLLGSPDYYGRFGFRPADSLGITSPDASWGSHFMALPLQNYDPALRGSFRYAAAFGLG